MISLPPLLHAVVLFTTTRGASAAVATRLFQHWRNHSGNNDDDASALPDLLQFVALTVSITLGGLLHDRS